MELWYKVVFRAVSARATRAKRRSPTSKRPSICISNRVDDDAAVSPDPEVVEIAVDLETDSFCTSDPGDNDHGIWFDVSALIGIGLREHE